MLLHKYKKKQALKFFSKGIADKGLYFITMVSE